MKINTLSHNNAGLPKLLATIFDPPKLLFTSGKSIPTDIVLLAIVGTRRPTAYGHEMTQRLINELAGYPVGIVSGMALGVDAIAHRAAIKAQLYTAAVLPSGLGAIYPATNRQLAMSIIKHNGTLISEYPHSTRPFKHYFLQRNRLIAGMCQATIVIEAAERSGALSTANSALQEGREVMAVPGNVTSPLSKGTNNLIRHGAHPVASGEDILSILGITSAEHLKAAYQPQNSEEALLLKVLMQGVTHIHELQSATRLQSNVFAQTITMLEINGIISEIGGGNYVIT